MPPLEDQEYFERFQDSKWVAQGADPEAEEKVKKEFEGKFGAVRRIAKKNARIRKLLEEVKLLFDFLVSGNDLGAKAVIVGALLYFISPLDLVPDFIPLAGYLDDAAIVAGVVLLLKDLLDKFRMEREGKLAKKIPKEIPAPKD